jgi:transcriptional regulator with XRE-family HTH domain
MDTLEERAGVSKRTISEIERGVRTPHTLTLAKLANALEVDLDELLEDEAPKDRAPQQLEWVLSVADVEMLRHRLRDVPTELLRGWIKALAGNQRHKTIEDMKSREGMNEAVAQSLLMFRATILREELLRREDEDPKDYLPDLRKHLDALGLD